jgi:hypothetical protein
MNSGVPRGSTLLMIYAHPFIIQTISCLRMILQSIVLTRMLRIVSSCSDIDIVQTWCFDIRILLNTGKTTVVSLTHETNRIYFNLE